jgi:hypothetical protein
MSASEQEPAAAQASGVAHGTALNSHAYSLKQFEAGISAHDTYLAEPNVSHKITKLSSLDFC